MENPSALRLGPPRAERADAARNRARLMDAARELVAELGVERVTMDGLAARADVGKGTVFRRFGTRAGIFRALLDADETEFQQALLWGPPPVGPGAPPLERLVAYGRARIEFLLEHQRIARAAVESVAPLPPGDASITLVHVRMLLGHLDVAGLDAHALSVQLTATIEGPVLFYLATNDSALPAEAGSQLVDGWTFLVERCFGTRSETSGA